VIASTAHPSEILLFLVSSTGFVLTFVTWRVFHLRVQDIRTREINGLISILAYGHERDERIRLIILGMMVIAAVLFTMAPSASPMPSELILARILLNVMSFLITLKSYYNMRDRDKVTKIQAHRRQRATDFQTGRIHDRR
jgi:hypothetical protein